MIEVLKSGIHSSIQDLGRYGVQHFGIPVAGVMDEYAAKLANSLVGNSQDSAVIEITYLGPTLRFKGNAYIALTGAHLSPTMDGKPIDQNCLIAVDSGAVLSFGKRINGYRCYMAVAGGLDSTVVLGSKSMFDGITENSRLLKGATIGFGDFKRQESSQFSKLKVNLDYLNKIHLEVYKGPEFDNLSKQSQSKLLSQVFSISKDNNRMGYQLNEHFSNNLKPIITSPVLPGTVQLTPSGKLIVLMKDCQTTGGYPRVLQLSASAMPILSQKITGDVVQFKLKT